MPLVLGVDALAGTTVRDLVREVSSRPTNPTVLYNFAATLERSGKDSLAAVVYMRALDFETVGSAEWAETVAAMCDAPRTPTSQPCGAAQPIHTRRTTAATAPAPTALRPRATNRRPLATHPNRASPRRFCKLIQPQCDGVPKPAWWDDQELLRLSQRNAAVRRWLGPRPAGAPEASLSGRPRLGRPRATNSLGRPAAWAALAGASRNATPLRR